MGSRGGGRGNRVGGWEGREPPFVLGLWSVKREKGRSGEAYSCEGVASVLVGRHRNEHMHDASDLYVGLSYRLELEGAE